MPDGRQTAKTITVTEDYLVLPVAKSGDTGLLSLWTDGHKILEFDIPIGDKEDTLYYSAIPVSRWRGSELELRLNRDSDKARDLLERISLSDRYEQPLHGGADQDRPAIHFTPLYGWLNDPNGLIYKDGVYHMYFQYNPLNVIWGNMSWGHAVSSDLLHWKQEPPALLPGKDGPIFSGCAVDNREKVGDLPEDARIFYYTCGGGNSAWSRETKSRFAQRMAFSTDGGKTLVTYAGGGLPCEQDEDRDPKIYWLEESGAYYMVLYLSGFNFGIYCSADLLNWKKTQELTFEGMRECPDLFPLPADNGEKWIFLSADGSYIAGDFDGYRFTPLQEKMSAYATELPYAGQTFAGTEKPVLVKWLRTWNKDKIYTGCMSLPVELGLAEKNGKYLLTQQFIENYEKQKCLFAEITGKEKFELEGIPQKGTVELEITWDESASRDRAFHLVSGHSEIEYHSDSMALCCHEDPERTGEAPSGFPVKKSSAAMTVPEGSGVLRILADGPVVEVLTGDGLTYGAFELDGLDESVWNIQIEHYKKMRIYVVSRDKTESSVIF